MRSRPVREGVGRAARVHERQRRLDLVALQVDVELRQLVAVQHALVDDRPRREAGDVEVAALGDVRPAHGLAHAAPDDVELPLEGVVGLDRRAPPDEELTDHRLRAPGRRAEHRVVEGKVAPAQKLLTLLADRLLEEPLASLAALGGRGQEHSPHAVVPRQRELDPETIRLPRHELVRDLNQNPGAVPRVDLGARGAAVLEVQEDLEPVLDDVPGTCGHEGRRRTRRHRHRVPTLRVIKTLRTRRENRLHL